jgi:hypothetical protein
MRMWNVNPKIMCRQHLLGEHAEIHMFIGTLNKGKTVKGYLEKGLLEVHNLYSRHRELVEEMGLRGYNHRSDVDKKWKNVEKLGFVDKKKSLIDIMERCPRCKQRYLENKTSK